MLTQRSVLLITGRTWRMREGNNFSLSVDTLKGGGGQLPRSLVPGPFPASGPMFFPGGTPVSGIRSLLSLWSHILSGGTPVLAGRGVPPAKTGVLHHPRLGYLPTDRACHGQDTVWVVRLLHFHAGGLSLRPCFFSADPEKLGRAWKQHLPDHYTYTRWQHADTSA